MRRDAVIGSMAGVLLLDRPLLWCRQWWVSLISGPWLNSVVGLASFHRLVYFLLGVHCAMDWLTVTRWLCAGDSDNNQLDGVTKCKSIMCAHMCVVPYKTSNIAERSARCHGRQTIYPMVTVSAEMSDNPRPSLLRSMVVVGSSELCPEESRAIDGSPNSACLSQEVVHATATMGDPTRAAGPWAEGEGEGVPNSNHPTKVYGVVWVDRPTIEF
ncbi:hypothetical protein BDQ94DRAFT_164406 [Aspergillus welwitschiae]|uniref:Uncharacterized protein n=1 Tax=Aspergillus welwitschiae TaxID=1341132 RepID=A0A3F3PIC3_9EURO|nr:hypothetical protein BDQ94DRAFT_164406 [Aspergillus welwitschiae]RDH26543.1 hypothetical protein BDQ94DRAFT_164406 [Aspergillus welwitschiae]